LTATSFSGDGSALTGLASDAISEGNTSAEVVDTGSDGHFKVITEGTERFRVDYTGRFLIGTTTPVDNTALEVEQKNESTNYNGIVLKNKTTNNYFHIFFNSDGNPTFSQTYGTGGSYKPLVFWTGNGERTRIDTSGRLLVGTTSGYDHSTITIQGNSGSSTADGILALRRGAGNPTTNQALGSFWFADGTNQKGGFIQMMAAGNWASGSSYPTSLTIGLTKNGTTSQTERLRMVDGGSIFTRSSDTGAQIGSEASAGTSVSLLQMGYGAYSIFNCTISFKVWTNGNVVNSNNSYGSLSDIKLKENIVDASSQWDDIKAIQIRKYNFKEETGYATHTQLGVVAQEVELVSPGLVYESPDKETVQIPVLDENGDAVLDENGDPTFTTEERETGEVTKSVNYSVMYMKAVKALQEAMERIETLETANASQAATIAALDARLTALEGA